MMIKISSKAIRGKVIRLAVKAFLLVLDLAPVLVFFPFRCPIFTFTKDLVVDLVVGLERPRRAVREKNDNTVSETSIGAGNVGKP
jgi:hypothetical protein